MKNCVLLSIFMLFSLASRGQTDCSEAITATLGTNTTPSAPYWFKYEASTTGDYTISSVGTATNDTYLEVYSDCDGTLIDESDDYQGGRQSELTQRLAEGDVIYIQWNGRYSTEGFNWNLTVNPLEPGDECEFTATAVSGTNKVTDTSNDYYWYTYSVPMEGRVQITSSSSSYVFIYDNTCDNLSSLSSGYGGAITNKLDSGTTVYVRWNVYGEDITWELTMLPTQPGEECSTAVTATVGNNDVPETTHDDYWYSYVMPSEGELQITSSSRKYVTVYSNTCDDLDQLGNGYGGVTVGTLTTGDRVLIKWDTSNGGNFDWDVSIVVPGVGDDCVLADTAALGTNTTPRAPYWFQYSVPTTGDYTISSVGTATNDTYLKIYSDCDGMPIRTNDDYRGLQSELTLSFTEGDTIYVLWDDDYSFSGFEWTIYKETFDEAECSDLTAITTEVVNAACDGTSTGVLSVAGAGGSAPYRYSLDGEAFQRDSIFTNLGTDEYTVFVKDVNGCVATTDITIFALGSLAVDGEVTHTTESDGNGSITLSVTGGEQPYQYVWSDQSTAPSLSDLSMGDYSVTITDAVGCSITRDFTVSGVTAVEEYQEQKVVVYPNPAHDVLYIALPFGNKAKTAALYSLVGRKVTEVSLTSGGSQLNVGKLNPGSYLLKLDDGTSQRVVIQ